MGNADRGDGIGATKLRDAVVSAVVLVGEEMTQALIPRAEAALEALEQGADGVPQAFAETFAEAARQLRERMKLRGGLTTDQLIRVLNAGAAMYRKEGGGGGTVQVQIINSMPSPR